MTTPAPTVLFAARAEQWEDYETPLTAALAEVGLKATLVTEADPETVDYIVYSPASPVQDFTPYTRLKAVLNLWAGVEDVVGNETLTVPLCRMVDRGLTEGMVEWVTGHALRHHLGMDAHITGQDGIWRGKVVPPLARDRTIGVLGLGALGRACARALSALNFRVVGWSRTAKDIGGVETVTGERGLDTVLARADILVLLLPSTASTEAVLDAERIARIRPGAVILNPGRGALIDDDALLAALDSGQIGHATLDVFREEPLPPTHPFWSHPRVTVTPHIASATRPESASRVIAANIARHARGGALEHVVDRQAGY
ncbi:MAG: 2-hydroxyacid dehydrogenase [Rubricella sp.]